MRRGEQQGRGWRVTRAHRAASCRARRRRRHQHRRRPPARLPCAASPPRRSNAGTNTYRVGPLANQAPEDIVAVVETNVLGVMLCEFWLHAACRLWWWAQVAVVETNVLGVMLCEFWLHAACRVWWWAQGRGAQRGQGQQSKALCCCCAPHVLPAAPLASAPAPAPTTPLPRPRPAGCKEAFRIMKDQPSGGVSGGLG